MSREDALLLIVAVGAACFMGVCIRHIAQERQATPQNLQYTLPPGVTRRQALGDAPHIEGDPHAPITLVEFGDYQCPPCEHAYERLHTLLATSHGRWNLAFRHYPLTGIHQYAYDAAVLAETAGEQGRFWQMHSLLYQHNTALQSSDLHTYATMLKLDAAHAQNTRKAREHVDKDMADADALKLNGTPSFIVLMTGHNPQIATLDTFAQVMQ